jgi:hypothetical protein
MKFLSLNLIFVLLCISLNGQNLIGYHSVDIQKYMREKKSGMNSVKVVNVSYKYLKYTDNSDSQTIFFFLNNDSICTSERIICSQETKPELIKEFNSKYKKNSDNIWIDRYNDKNYLIKMNDEKWSCTFTIESEKNIK